MDDERLKNPGGWDYFDELLARIREIRASEKRFYQKVRDLFALSSDYKGREQDTQLFFAEVQNKLLYAAMNLAIRGIEGDLGPVYSDRFRRDLHKDLKADDVLANPPFNDLDWHRSDEDVRWNYDLPPKGNANFATSQFINNTQISDTFREAA